MFVRLVGRLAGRLAAGEPPGFPDCLRSEASRGAGFPALLAEAGILDEPLGRLIEDYRAGLAEAAAGLRSSRAKDHERGARIMADYARTHAPLDNDEIVIKFEKRAAEALAAAAALEGRA